MFKKRLFIIAVGAISLLYIGCANYSVMQSADVIGKGKKKMGVGMTYTQYQLDIFDSTATKVNVPAADFWYRYGITDKFEVHSNIWIPLGISLGMKYQLIGSPEKNGFALSSGLDIGYLQITSGDQKTNLIDFYVPIYFGVDFSKIFSIYLVPKYVGRLSVGSSSSAFFNSAAGTFGIKIGNRVSVLLEGTYGIDFSSKHPISTFGIGVDF